MAGTSGVGTTIAAIGVAILAFSLLPHGTGWAPAAIGMLLVAAGSILILAGARRPAPMPSITPAHVTFYQQVRREVPMPPVPAARAESAYASDLEPVTAVDLELARLDVEIREITRKISKATVMRGTGKLSDEGFRRYVEDLKKERADLEGARVRIEMARETQ